MLTYILLPRFLAKRANESVDADILISVCKFLLPETSQKRFNSCWKKFNLNPMFTLILLFCSKISDNYHGSIFIVD